MTKYRQREVLPEFTSKKYEKKITNQIIDLEIVQEIFPKDASWKIMENM